MSADTTGFIALKQSQSEMSATKLLHLMELIREALQSITTKSRQELIGKLTNAIVGYRTYGHGTFRYEFMDGDDDRVLHLHLDCNRDYSATYRGAKIVFSLGQWGRSVEIITQVGTALQQAGFGDFYLRPDEGKENEWVKPLDPAGIIQP
jgi:hypothetical protein